MSTQRDESRLLDMLRAADTIAEYLSGVDEATFARHPMLQDAIIRQVMVIGEAAYQTSAEFRETHASLPWIEMIGMRHRLVHGYGDISTTTVWETACRDVPEIAVVLRRLVNRDD